MPYIYVFLNVSSFILNIYRFKKIEPIDNQNNPLVWWRKHEEEFPLLALFMKANASFQPTSLASERCFNKDRMLFGTTRKSITEEHANGMIFLHDYIRKRCDEEAFRLCEQCPSPPSDGTNYKITCPKHNTPAKDEAVTNT